jgi:hypothetical protein
MRWLFGRKDPALDAVLEEVKPLIVEFYRATEAKDREALKAIFHSRARINMDHEIADIFWQENTREQLGVEVQSVKPSGRPTSDIANVGSVDVKGKIIRENGKPVARGGYVGGEFAYQRENGMLKLR